MEKDYLDRFHEISKGLGLSDAIANKIANFIHYEIQTAKKVARTKVINDAEGVIAEFGNDPASVLGILDESWHGRRDELI